MYADYEIFGCAYDCPFQERLQACPFTEIEQLKFKEKIVWIKEISNGEKNSMIEHHKNCMWNRENKLG